MRNSDTVDGRNPAPFGMYKNPVNNGTFTCISHINWCRIFFINSTMMILKEVRESFLDEIRDQCFF